MKELELQRRLLTQILKEGGVGRKQSNRFSIGVPDLLLSLPVKAPPGRLLVEAEVKLLHYKDEPPINGKGTLIDITPMQLINLARFQVGVVIVGVCLGAADRLAMVQVLPRDAERYHRNPETELPVVKGTQFARPLTEAILREIMK